MPPNSNGFPSPRMVVVPSAIAAWFFAMISKGPKGDYIKGQIEHLDGIPVDVSGNSTEGGGLTEENCKEWGYTDFSGAT
jgi:hypothetical protein